MTAPGTCNPTTLKTIYLGQPGNMTKLQTPNAGYTAPFDRGNVLHALLGGGNGLTRRRKTRREYTIAYGGLLEEQLDPIMAFFTGLNGAGPFTLIDPAIRNQASLDVSTMGQQVGAIVGWDTPAADTQPAFDSTLAPFQESSGVLRWNSAVNAHYLSEWQNVGGIYIPDATNSVPYLPDQPAVLSFYAKTATATCSVIPTAFGTVAAGSSTPVTLAGTTTTLTTTYQRLSVIVPAGQSGWSFALTPFIGMALKCNQASAPVIHVSNAMIQIGPSKADPWTAGLGAPRMLPTDVMDNAVDVFWRSDNGLILVEQ